MNSIIAENLREENKISSRIDTFFKYFSISKHLKKSNFCKEAGIPCLEVLKFIFTLVFTNKNLYRTLDVNPESLPFSKNTVYRFLNSMSYNWAKLLTLISTEVINFVNATTSKEHCNVLIIDDSFYDRNRSKKVELLTRVFDHSAHKYVKGFKMLTLGWSDGNTFIPAAFSLLSSRKESNILCPSNAIDKRTLAYQRRKSAVSNSTEVMFQLLDSAKHLPAKYVLFDSWFAFPKTICNICKRKYDVICMIKNSSKIHYGYQDEWMDIKKLYSIIKNSNKNDKDKSNIIGSINVCVRESKNSQETKEVKIVFVKDRQSKNYLAVLSTDITLTNEEIIRIYGKRWDIEVFFKMCKSYLALSKEYQGRSYDMMTAHTTIVFMRYIMLSVENRNSIDNRTIGGFFYDICDELQDINFTTSLMFLLDTLKQVLSEYSLISESLALEIIDNFFNRLPSIWKHKLQSCA